MVLVYFYFKQFFIRSKHCIVRKHKPYEAKPNIKINESLSVGFYCERNCWERVTEVKQVVSVCTYTLPHC